MTALRYISIVFVVILLIGAVHFMSRPRSWSSPKENGAELTPPARYSPSVPPSVSAEASTAPAASASTITATPSKQRAAPRPLYATVKNTFQTAFCRSPNEFPPAVPPPLQVLRIATGIDSITYGNGRAASTNSRFMTNRPNIHKGGNWPISLWWRLQDNRRFRFANDTAVRINHTSGQRRSSFLKWKNVRAWIENLGERGATFMTRPRGMRCNESSNNTYETKIAKNVTKRFDIETYRCRPAFKVYSQFVPHVVILSGGTNDAKNRNWGRSRRELKRAVNSLINFFLYNNRRERYKQMGFKPWVILMAPIPAEENSSGAHKYNINASRIESDIVPIMREIGRERRREIDFLDMHKLFKRELLERQPCPPPPPPPNVTTLAMNNETLISPSTKSYGKHACWLRDGVHPTARGHKAMSHFLAEFMCK